MEELHKVFLFVHMMLHLYGYSRPDIANAVNCAAHYMFYPRHSHELALEKIGKYLKATCSRGLILNPSSNLKIDYYPGADLLAYMNTRKQTIQLV